MLVTADAKDLVFQFLEQIFVLLTERLFLSDTVLSDTVLSDTVTLVFEYWIGLNATAT